MMDLAILATDVDIPMEARTRTWLQQAVNAFDGQKVAKLLNYSSSSPGVKFVDNIAQS